jgi:cytochrome c oxidase assembly factor CtaG
MSDPNGLWYWASPVWLVAAALLVAYLLIVRGASRARLAALAIGLALLVLAFVSPIGVLADGYLFTAHMVQHLLLLLLVPLCLLLALPPQQAASWFSDPRLDRLGRWLSVATVGWICGVGAMWFWHVPTLCSAATLSHFWGGVRDVSFLVAGLAFWWPIYAPAERYRLEPLTGIVYLFSACLGCTLLGIYITFTTISVCPAFLNPVGRIGIMNMLYDAGMTPSVDQHLGGLMMWVPPCTLYVSAIISLLCRWYGTMDDPPQLLPHVTIPVRGQSSR